MTEGGRREVVRRRMERSEEEGTGDNGFYADRKFKMVDSEGQKCFENL
jgi:hypothetical protein